MPDADPNSPLYTRTPQREEEEGGSTRPSNAHSDQDPLNGTGEARVDFNVGDFDKHELCEEFKGGNGQSARLSKASMLRPFGDERRCKKFGWWGEGGSCCSCWEAR
ncbi:hypothetical protein NL676_035872 [Syzygium grande]|nr:hypothetical protein NL676_035872 [Syzygium grande]